MTPAALGWIPLRRRHWQQVRVRTSFSTSVLLLLPCPRPGSLCHAEPHVQMFAGDAQRATAPGDLVDALWGLAGVRYPLQRPWLAALSSQLEQRCALLQPAQLVRLVALLASACGAGAAAYMMRTPGADPAEPPLALSPALGAELAKVLPAKLPLLTSA